MRHNVGVRCRKAKACSNLYLDHYRRLVSLGACGRPALRTCARWCGRSAVGYDAERPAGSEQGRSAASWNDALRRDGIEFHVVQCAGKAHTLAYEKLAAQNGTSV